MGPQEREKGGVESLQEVSWPRGLLSPKGTCLSGGLALAGSLPRFSRDLGNPLTPRNATSSGETPASGVATVRSAGWSASGNLCFPRCVPKGGFPWAKRSLSYRKYHGRGQELPAWTAAASPDAFLGPLQPPPWRGANAASFRGQAVIRKHGPRAGSGGRVGALVSTSGRS